MRTRKHPIEIVAELFQIFGVDFVGPAQARPTELVQVFAECKAQAKANYKDLALQHHPDRGGDAERFKSITAAWTKLSKIEIKPRPRPQPRPQHVSVVVNVVRSSYTSTSTTSSYTDPFGW